MEGVLTALLAWFVFKENFDRRIFLGMVAIVAGGVLLSWEQCPAIGVPWGALAIVAACLCWAIDNNLTRKVSTSDACACCRIAQAPEKASLADRGFVPNPLGNNNATTAGLLSRRHEGL